MDVRTAAATYLLRYRTAEAKAVLEEAAKGEGLIPFEAQEALKRWAEGAWSLDPERLFRSGPECQAGPSSTGRRRPALESSSRTRFASAKCSGLATVKRSGVRTTNVPLPSTC